MKNNLIAALSLGVLLVGCTDDVVDEESCETPFNFSSGAVVANEGPFGGTGSLSHLDLDNGKVTNFIYEKANCDVPAGQFIQSVAYNDDKGYVIANGSGEVQVIGLSNFKYNQTLSFSYPRYMAFKGNSGYLTNGNYGGKVYKISTGTSIVTDSVVVGSGPEAIVALDNNIVVANSGGWELDSSISFINAATFEVDSTLVLGYKPNDIVVANNGNIWVSCAGLASWDLNGPTAPQLFEVNPSSKSIVNTYTVGTTDESISKLAINASEDVVYFYNENGVHAFNTDGSTTLGNALISGSFYGVEVDPSTGNVLVFDAKDYASDGSVGVYSSTGDSLTSYTVGVSPNGAVFK
jgi:hypothetical protein